MASVAVQHREQIIQQLLAGRYLKDIAADLKVSPPAISQVLASDPEYQQARECAMAAKLDDAHAKLELASASAIDANTGKVCREITSEQLNLVRACEAVAKRLEWRAEREFPHRWGAKQQIEHSIAPVFAIQLASSTATLPNNEAIDGECERK